MYAELHFYENNEALYTDTKNKILQVVILI